MAPGLPLSRSRTTAKTSSSFAATAPRNARSPTMPSKIARRAGRQKDRRSRFSPTEAAATSVGPVARRQRGQTDQPYHGHSLGSGTCVVTRWTIDRLQYSGKCADCDRCRESRRWAPHARRSAWRKPRARVLRVVVVHHRGTGWPVGRRSADGLHTRTGSISRDCPSGDAPDMAR